MDLKVVLVRVMSPIDASLTWILAGWLAGIIRASEEEQECKGATQSHRALKHIRIHVLQSRPLSIPLTYFLFGILAAVHFNLISDHQSSPELKLTRFARECLGLPISLHIRPKKCRRSRPLSDASEPVKLEKPLDGRTEWISVVM